MDKKQVRYYIVSEEEVLKSDWRGVSYSKINTLRLNFAMITPVLGTVKNIGKLRITRKK